MIVGDANGSTLPYGNGLWIVKGLTFVVHRLGRTRDSVAQASIRLLGVRIDCLDARRLIYLVRDEVKAGAHSTVLYVNVHCMNVQARDPVYARILDKADIVYCDGTGVQLGALLAGLPLPPRTTGADWIWSLCRAAIKYDLSLFFVGGVPGSAEHAAMVLRVRFPGLRILGTCHGYGAGEEAVEAINRADPDIVLIGMGTPTQEKWIEAHRSQIDAPVVWAVGALFDFVSGRIPRGPRWMTNHGLEWACRLAAEPRKLWRRYLIGNPLFLIRVFRHYWSERSGIFLHRLRQDPSHLWPRKLGRR